MSDEKFRAQLRGENLKAGIDHAAELAKEPVDTANYKPSKILTVVQAIVTIAVFVGVIWLTQVI